MSFYRLLVLIHVFSAILGLGPGFILIYITRFSTNLTELRYSFELRKRLHVFIVIGGSMLFITGLAMGMLNLLLFRAFWYVSSLILFTIALIIGPVFLSPRASRIKTLLSKEKGSEIPQEYFEMAKSLFFWERVENVIFLIIIMFMILKPYNAQSLLRMFYLA